MPQRLHVLLAHAGVASRRQAETMIREGRIRVDGQIATIGQQVEGTEHITIDDKAFAAAPTEHTYVIINKPIGLVSTTSDELGRKTVLSVLPPSHRQKRLYPVGRLDTDSEGLLLLTDDGEVAYRLTHASFKVAKTYWTLLDRPPSQPALEHLRSGIKLFEGWVKPVEVAAVPIASAPSEGVWWSMTIIEGRYHQVKRMWQRSGYEVNRLIRVAFGPLRLDDLEGKSWRELSADEVRTLRTSVGLTTD